MIAGLIGGARVVEQLRQIVAALRMVPVSPAVHVPEVTRAMTDQGGFAADSLDDVLTAMLEELAWYGSVLTPARLAS